MQRLKFACIYQVKAPQSYIKKHSPDLLVNLNLQKVVTNPTTHWVGNLCCHYLLKPWRVSTQNDRPP